MVGMGMLRLAWLSGSGMGLLRHEVGSDYEFSIGKKKQELEAPAN